MGTFLNLTHENESLTSCISINSERESTTYYSFYDEINTGQILFCKKTITIPNKKVIVLNFITQKYHTYITYLLQHNTLTGELKSLKTIIKFVLQQSHSSHVNILIPGHNLLHVNMHSLAKLRVFSIDFK